MKVTVEGKHISDEEKLEYVKYVKNKYSDRTIRSVVIVVGDDDYVDIKCEFGDFVPFDRIRRITGYLVGTLDRFNNGKRAEESQRVKHNI